MPRIRAVSFNILHGRRADGTKVVDHDLLGRSAAGLAADLLALQEVDVGVPRSERVDQAAAVGSATGLHHVFAEASRVGGIGMYGNALLARGRIAEVEVAALPREDPGNEARVALLASVHLEGVAPVTVAATHLSIRRPEVYAQLYDVVDRLLARPGPHILIGDLNLVPGEVAPMVEAAGLRLALTDRPTFPNGQPRVRIDHVAVSDDIGILGVDVVATPSSDHCALVVGLEVP